MEHERSAFDGLDEPRTSMMKSERRTKSFQEVCGFMAMTIHDVPNLSLS